LNKQNAPLNHDMTQLIDRVRDGSVIAPPAPPAPPSPHSDFAKYGEPASTKH
jgi:hypothetical protein